jgi:hypothetical protein
MNKRARVMLRRFRRVQDFLTTNPVDGTQVKLQVLGEITRLLSECNVEQEASRRLTKGHTAKLTTLRRVLWNQHMVPLARIARRVIVDNAEVQAKLKLPPSRTVNERIVAVAGGMVEMAEQHAAVLVSEGLPADSLERMRAAIDALASALPDRSNTLNRKSKSLEVSAKLVKQGIRALEVLDAIVLPRLEDQPDLLAAWKIAKRPVDAGGGSGSAAPVDITPVVKVA